MQKRFILPYLKGSLAHYSQHRASRMGAAISYYTIFSIIPLLSLVILIAGSLLGKNYIQTELGAQIANLIGQSDSAFLDSLLSAVSIQQHGLATLISIVVLIIGTLGVLYELKNALDDLWETAPSKARSGFKYAIFSRLLTLSVIPVLIFLLLISLVFSALLSAFGNIISAHTGATFLFKVLNLVFSYAVVTFLFAFIYKYLPAKKLPWKEILCGALATGLLFMLGKSLIGLYIGKFASTSVFGAAGTLIILLLWIYYSVQIFFFGASLTYVYSERYGYVKKHKNLQ